MTNFGHSYARYTNPARYRLAKISHHFRVASAPKELIPHKKSKMVLLYK